MKKWIVVVAIVSAPWLVSAPFYVSAQSGTAGATGSIDATTATGERVRLLPDGRWEWIDGPKAAAQKQQREVEVKKQEEVRQAEIKRERAAQGGGGLGFGRTIYEGEKDYNRGSLNPKTR